MAILNADVYCFPFQDTAGYGTTCHPPTYSTVSVSLDLISVGLVRQLASEYKDYEPVFHPVVSLVKTQSLLQKRYFNEKSHGCFIYQQASFLVNNIFVKEYRNLYVEKKAQGYTKEELKKLFAFQYFETESQAKQVFQYRVHFATSTITTLGDPAKGVYVSKYSDYLHPRPWYHGKSGFIVIFKFLKGKVKAVCENYTDNYTLPTPGYDCHISEYIDGYSEKSSHFRSFELTQYYVYEICNDHFRRPRQLCPLVIVAFQYIELRRNMPVLQDTEMVNNPEFYNAWKGQMFIQDQLVCDIALQSSGNSSIPTHLSDKLEIREVIRLSELKQKLPDVIFEKAEFTGQEVCCGDVFYSIYQVVTSNVVGSELEKLQKWMKDQELAIVKFLNDQGFLVLITSPKIKTSKDLQQSDSTCLTALFLFPHSKSLATKDIEQWGKDVPREEISRQVTTLLPGLQYAIMETNRTLKEKELYPDALERCFKKFAVLQKKKDSPSEDKEALSPLTEVSPNTENSTSEKCSPLEFDRLQSYISAPVNYCVPVVKASILLVGEAAFSSNSLDLSNCGSDLTDALQTKLCLEDKTNNEPPVTEVSNDKALLQEKEKPIATTSTKGKGPKRRMKRGKRRRLHSTKKAYTHPEIKKNSLQSKDKIQNISLSRTTLKLFSAQCSQGRKRGAEVLTAEFIQDTSPERPQKRLPIKRPRRTSKNVLPSRRSERTPKKRPPEVPVEPGNPPKRKILEQGESSGDKNVPETSDPSVGKIEKVKKPRRNMDTTKTVVRGQGKTFSKPAENGGVEDAHILEKRLNMYESHALNLLADLALNSFNSSSIPFAPTESVESENAGLAEKKDVPVETPSNDHENPMDNNAEPPCIPPVPSSAPAPPPPEEPAPITEAPPEPPESTKVSCEAEESPQPNKEHRKKQKPQKSPVLSKVPIDQASKISMEHSYSHLPTDEQTPEPAPSKSPEPAVQAAPDSPVLPQATEVVIQQSPNSVILSGEIIFVTSTNQVLCPVVKPEARSVLKLGDKFLITFSSDAKYDFDLDSKFTSDPLEKTINRALHGPWNPNLKEKVEDVKIILHMWLALFYSKSNKQLNRRTRKVVEHSNPAKYVSINTALDPFELYKFVESESINIGLTPLPPCASSSHNPGVILPYANAIHSPYPGKLPLPALPRIPKPEKIHLKQEAKEIKRELKNDGKPGSQRSVTQIQKKTTLPTVTYTTNESSKEEKATENRDGCIPIVCYISDAKHSAPDTQLNCKAESADLANTATEKVNNGEHSTEVSSTSLIQDVMDHEFDTCQEIVTSQETYVSDERKDKFETLFGSQSEAEVGPLQDDQLVSSTRPCIEPDKKAWPKLGINDLNMDAHIPSPVTACHSDSSSDGYSTPPRSATNLYIPPVVEGKVAHVERGLTYMPIIGFGSNSAVRLSDTIASRQTSAACAWPKVEVAKTENHIPPIDFLHANNRTKECCTVYKASDIVTSKVLEILKQVPKVSTESLTPRCEESKLSQSEAALVELPAQTQDNEDISCKTSTDNLVSLDLESTQPLLSPKHSGVDVIVHEVTVSKTKQVVNMDLMISEPVDVTSLRLWENQPAVVVEKIHQLGENEPWSHSSFFSNYASSIDGIVDSIGAEDTGSLNLESSREEQKICSLTVKESKVEEKQVSPELICLSPNPNNELCDALVETGSNKQSHDNYTPIFLDEAKYPCTETKQLSVKNDRLDENSNQQFESLGENLSPASMQPTDEIPDTNNVKETDSYEPNQVGSQTSSLGDINMDLSAVHMIDQSELVISQTKSASLDPESSTQDPQTCPLSNKVTLVDVEQNNSSSQEELLASQYLLDKAEATGVNLFLLENSEKLPSHPEGKLSQTEECEVVVLDSNSSPSSVEAFEESDGLSLQRSCTPSIQDVYGYEHMDSVSTREPSDICLIANIASISEEQYERWDDEDVSQVNKETQKTISDQKYYQMISHSTSENTQESTCTAKSKSTRYLQKRSSSRPRLRETDEYFPWHHREADYQNPRDYGNFTVTKSLKESGRTLQSSHREVGLLSHKRFVNGDLTQNTIDLEHLRFIHRLKRVLRNTSSDDFLYETPYLTMFESKRIPGCSNSSSKSTSPMLITVHCSESRREPRGHDQWYAGSYYTQRVCDDELRDRPAYYSRTPKKVRPRTHRNVSPFPLNRLMYESSSEDLDNGFSVALKDSVQSNHLRLSRVGLGNSKVDRTTARDLLEKSTVQTRKTFVPSSKDSHVVKNIISDHCTRIQSKLSSVIKESAKRNFRFYIIETSDDPFFTLTKNLLKKDGHTSVEPQHFSHSQHESERLLVIIRIEDISSHIHKIPCLLQLKLSPNVAFAGVDNPEDVTESTYEELFQAGGFVVSDPTLLETITLGKLKEVLAVLEKMNKSSAWKWLVHYRENKRLKEDKRSDSASQVKISLLKSYQQMNVIEILPYHQCDSTGKEQPEDLTCALTLQSQRIHSRLAVYLTESDKLSATREEFEQNGILAFDVDTFIRSLQKLDARVQSSCWP